MSKNNELSMLKHYCYLITNNINGKIYVGITYKDIGIRFKEHIKVSKLKDVNKKQYIHKSIAKYGENNFSIKLLEEFNNGKEAYDKESVYIAQFKSNNSNFGYNLTKGGDQAPIYIKYNKEFITLIINDLCNGISTKNISIKYGVSKNTIFDISRLRISASITISKKLLEKLKNYKNNFKRKKRVNKKIIISVIKDFINGKVMKELGKDYKLSQNNIWNIIHREIWKNIDIGDDLENKLKEKLSGSVYWKNKKIDGA